MDNEDRHLGTEGSSPNGSSVEEDAEAAWDLEIARRVAELDAGLVKPIPWPEARRMVLDGADE